MKVLVVTHYFPPHHGGIENVAYSQAKTLIELGHDVTVVTSKIPKDFSKFDELGLSIVRVSAANILENNFGVPYPLFSLKLFGILRKEVKKADIVHAHGHVYATSVVAALMSLRYRKPFVLTQHNTFVDYKSRLLRGLQRGADLTLGRLTLNLATEVVAVSNATQKYVQTISSTKSVVHHNGTDVDRFRPVEDPAALRSELSIPTDKIICFCVRRITFKNGIDTLLETAQLLRKRDDIFFLIGGKGPDLHTAEEYVKANNLNNVRLLGMVRDEDLPRYYAASNIFILPSKNGEGFPLVILEALASGLPVIATRSGGHAEFIEASSNGYIVEPNQPAQIAEKIESIISKPTQLARMQRDSRRFAEQSLSWSKNVENLLDVFQEAMA